MAILFLEPDDEITSAVGRLRDAGDRNVALVLPEGSRIASSRINFRLLAREAGQLGTDLAIVAPEATARALASAAGLPTFSTVGRYEAAMAAGGLEAGAPADAGQAVSRQASEPQAPIGAAAATAPTVVGIPAVAPPGPGSVPVARGPKRPGRPAISVPRFEGAPLVAALVLLLIVGVGTAAGVYFVLPQAQVTITPRLESFGPVVTQVTADPGATTTDPAAGVVPAAWVQTTVNANDTFPATGVNVTETSATGSVTFSSYNTGSTTSIPSGSIVKTKAGIAFTTASSVRVPAATVDLSTKVVTPGRASVAITASVAGTSGNVGVGTITVIPKGYNPNLLTVTNPRATSGGTHTETKVVKQSDYDSAVSALQKKLQQSFQEWIAAGPTGTANLLVIADSATLANPTLDPAATDVVGKAMTSFGLSAQAAGQILTVDPADLDQIGASRFPSVVPAGYTVVGTVQVTSTQVSSADPASPRYEVTATGKAYRGLDVAGIKRLVVGKPIDQARAALSSYGDASITLTPDWFGTVPQFDWRVNVEIRVPAQGS